MEANDKLVTARKKELYVDQILSLWNSLNKYLEYRRAAAKLSRKNFQPYHTAEYKAITTVVNAISKDIDKFIASMKESRAKAAKMKAKQDAKRLAKALADFNEYKTDSFRIGEEDYLRLSKEGDAVETSQGVRVSINGAKLLYSAIKSGQDIVGRHIDSYTVKAINGVLTIGCHRINMASVKQIGEQLINA